PAESRHVHLAAVRMATEHQIATLSIEPLHGARVVREDDGGSSRRKPGKGLVQIAGTAPEVLHADQIHMCFLPSKLHGLIVQDPDAVRRQRGGHGTVKMAK